jgi:hypothetical protein
MRAAAVLFALVVTPFVAGVAQGTPFSDPKNCGLHLSYSVRAGTRRPDAALVHGGKHGVMDRPCPSDAPVVQPPADTTVVVPVQPPADTTVVSPPAPACPVTEQPTAGTLSIEGRVTDQYTYAGLANWCIHLTGPVSATVQTDPYGYYKFTGLPDVPDSFTVCEDVQSGWTQDFPTPSWGGVPCPTGLGWEFPLWGWPASQINFRNHK